MIPKTFDTSIPISSNETEEQSITNQKYQPSPLEIIQNTNIINPSSIDQIYLCGIIPYKKQGHMKIIPFSLLNTELVIGPHWMFFIVLTCIIFALSIFLNKHLFSHLKNILFQLIFYILILLIIAIYTINLVKEPGIDKDKEWPGVNKRYCDKCSFYVNKNSDHCNMCGVCIEELDHHCIWVGKCVGKNNKKCFYCLVWSVAVIYPYIIGCVIYYYIINKN